MVFCTTGFLLDFRPFVRLQAICGSNRTNTLQSSRGSSCSGDQTPNGSAGFWSLSRLGSLDCCLSSFIATALGALTGVGADLQWFGKPYPYPYPDTQLCQIIQHPHAGSGWRGLHDSQRGTLLVLRDLVAAGYPP